MAEPAQDTASLRFRLYDGTDIGPVTYATSTTVGAVKEAVLRDWPQACARLTCRVRLRPPDVPPRHPSPQERERPEGPGALKLILSGRLLGNEMTLADARTPTDALVTMHLVVAPPKVRRAGALLAARGADACRAAARCSRLARRLRKRPPRTAWPTPRARAAAWCPDNTVKNACKTSARPPLPSFPRRSDPFSSAQLARALQTDSVRAGVVPWRLARQRLHAVGCSGSKSPRSLSPWAALLGAQNVRRRCVSSASGDAHASAAPGVALRGSSVQAPAAAADHRLPPHGRAGRSARPAPAEQ